MPTVGELYAGIELSATKAKNLPKLRRGLVDFFLWPLDRPAAKSTDGFMHYSNAEAV